MICSVDDVFKLRRLKDELREQEIKLTLHLVNLGNLEQVKLTKRIIGWKCEQIGSTFMPLHNSIMYTELTASNIPRVRVHNTILSGGYDAYYCKRSETCYYRDQIHCTRTKKLILRKLRCMESLQNLKNSTKNIQSQLCIFCKLSYHTELKSCF